MSYAIYHKRTNLFVQGPFESRADAEEYLTYSAHSKQQFGITELESLK